MVEITPESPLESVFDTSILPNEVLRTPWIDLPLEKTQEIVNEVAKLVGLKDEDDDKVKIYFVEEVFEKFAVTDGYFDDNGNIELCNVFISTSIESLLESIRPKTEEELDPDDHQLQRFLRPVPLEQDTIDYLTVEEYLVGVCAEELHHALYYIRAGSEERVKEWQKRYQSILENRGELKNHKYEVMLPEMAAGRVELQTLYRYFRDRNPERSQYFKEKWRKSLDEGIRIMPSLFKLLPAVLQPHGYDIEYSVLETEAS